jgi:hypothetical protein
MHQAVACGAFTFSDVAALSSLVAKANCEHVRVLFKFWCAKEDRANPVHLYI